MEILQSRILTMEDAERVTGGGLSSASKMPCPTYSIPAEYCRTGTILRGVKGSACEGCYACDVKSGWYMKSRVLRPMTTRLLNLTFNPLWLEGMLFIFKHYRNDVFRWHDSGDIQSVVHLAKICYIAKMNPGIKFWLPTQEWEMVRKYVVDLKQKIPDNLIIRLSARMVDGQTPVNLAKALGVQVSKTSLDKFDCPASHQDDKCMDCRKCWDRNIMSITYKYHGRIARKNMKLRVLQ